MVTLGSSDLPVTTPPPSPHLLPPTPPMTPTTAVMKQEAGVAELKESSDEGEPSGCDGQPVTGSLPAAAQVRERDPLPPRCLALHDRFSLIAMRRLIVAREKSIIVYKG